MESSTNISDLALLRLLQLASPALPVGAYSYSQGLEWAIEEGVVSDPASALRWIHDALHFSMGRFEAPTVWRLHQAWAEDDMNLVEYWNCQLCASRETAEFRAETLQMGNSLLRLLAELTTVNPARIAILRTFETVGFATVFSLAAVEWHIPAKSALLAYLWMWTENQVIATLKAVPLGQVAGQILLSKLSATLPYLAEKIMLLQDDELSNFAPALAIASSRHETQYSRLFRS